MRIAIVGSRDYKDLEAVRGYVRSLADDTVVMSGGARGVDRVAAAEARKCRLTVIEFLADWNGIGKGAGYIRNRQIVADCDKVVAFWDGKSKGTLHTITLAQRAGKAIEIKRYE